jgi:hypothetical protein
VFAVEGSRGYAYHELPLCCAVVMGQGLNAEMPLSRNNMSYDAWLLLELTRLAL